MPGGFFKVNNSIFDEKLTAHEFYVYCYLLRCDNPKNGCFPSKKTIANACGIAVSTVSKCIQSLEKRGHPQLPERQEAEQQLRHPAVKPCPPNGWGGVTMTLPLSGRRIRAK